METLQRTANRGSISTGYDIENSLKLESDNSEYLDNRHHTAGNRRTWTLSFWIKRTELGTTQKPYDAGNVASIGFLSTDKIQIENSNLYLVTDKVFRDTSAWYHIVQLNDSTQSTASNRAKLWINGVQETSFSSETYMAQNQEGNINSATSVSIGGGGGAHVNGYMAELFFVDGQALSPTDFGEFDEDTGIWKPKEYEGTLSGTSIKLDFSNSAALWEDSSGLTGNGTAMSGNNITAADQATDTPTNSFCIFNPTFSWIYSGNDASATILNGGTTADNIALSPGTAWKGAVGTMAVNKGKWYWELEYNGGAFGHHTHGILTTEFSVKSVYASDDYSNQLYFRDGGTPTIRNLIDGSSSTLHTMTSYTAGSDVYAIALNMDDEEATFYRNGTAITINGTSNTTIDISSVDGVSKYVYPLYSCYGSSDAHYNFGGYTVNTISSAESDENGYGTFEYAPPSGYYALCTKNLAEYG